MLNVDLKIISKALLEKLKEVLPDLICSQQTAYVKKGVWIIRPPGPHIWHLPPAPGHLPHKSFDQPDILLVNV